MLDYYDAIAGEYDASRFTGSYENFLDSAERRILKTWLSKCESRSVIDFGCGTGRLLSFAKTGVDGSEKMLQVAAAKFPRHRLIHSDLTALPSDLGQFDAGICFHVAMHLRIDQIQALLAQASHVVQPGGKLMFDFLAAPRRNLS